MTRLTCPCGHTIVNCASPSTVAGSLISDYDLDFHASVADMAEREPEIVRDVWECPECGRLAISNLPDDCQMKWYKPEDGQHGKLMGDRTQQASDTSNGGQTP